MATTKFVYDQHAWKPPQELLETLAQALGGPEKSRTAEDVRDFLAWFNARKTGWGGVSDAQLEVLIRAHIRSWSYWKQYGVKVLIDKYRAEENKRKKLEGPVS